MAGHDGNGTRAFIVGTHPLPDGRGSESGRYSKEDVKDGHDEEDGVEAIEKAPVAREELGRVLDAHAALHPALKEVASLGDHREEDGKGGDFDSGDIGVEEGVEGEDRGGARDPASNGALPRFAGADGGRQLVAADSPPDGIGARVGGEGGEDAEEDPGTAIGGVPDEDQGREEADVERQPARMRYGLRGELRSRRV
jgi:hypothetical protein